MVGELKQTGGGRYDWIPEDGTPFEGIRNDCDAPINILIDAQIADNRLVSYEYAPRPRAQTESVLNLCLLQVVDSSEDDTESLRKTLKRYAREWEHHMRSQDPEGEYHCTPCVVVDNIQGRGLFFTPRQVKDQIPDFANFTHWAIRGGHKSGTKGEAYLNSDKLAWYSGGVDTFVHETHHMYKGRGHSNGGDGQEYGDRTCIMGRALTGLNAYHVIGLGLSDRIIEVTESTTVYLAPIEVSHFDLLNRENHVAKVEHNRRKFLLSLRKSETQNFCGLRNHDSDTLFIHAPDGNQWWRVRSLYKGSTEGEREIEGITFRNLGGGEIQIIIDSPAPNTEKPKPLPVVRGDDIEAALSGIWHDSRYKQQGFDFTFHDGKLTGYWYGHHPRGKHKQSDMSNHSGRRWMILQGHDAGGYVEFEAWSADRGGLVEEGKGTIRFDRDTAFLRWQTEMYGREHYQLTRVSPPKVNARHYSFGEHSGISVSDYHDFTVVFYFGPGLGGQDWKYMEGQPDSLRVYSMEQRHRETHGGDVEELGTARIVSEEEFEMLGRTYEMERFL